MNKTQQTNASVVNFSELMNRLLALLTDKEKDIIQRRFSLNNYNKETLDKIGKSYSITRERVRQIEAMAIKKFARISMDPTMQSIHNMAYKILTEHGKVMSEDILVSKMIKQLEGTLREMDASSMKLAMRVSDKLIKQERNQFFCAFWRTKDVPLDQIKKGIASIKSILNKQKDVLSLKEIIDQVSIDPEMAESLLYVDWNFMETEEGWGLKSWRFINPRSIKDKILIALKEAEKPMHFTEIIKHVLTDFTSKKPVTPQAIHNELIRHDEFVLVGRGEYGLKEWGLAEGTVCNVIKSVLIENGEPMKRQDIIQKTLEKRDIRLGTISLNLQKYPFFKRVGRAVYEYDPSLEISPKKRGRKPKNHS